jgi:hypothetical protein
MAAGFKITDSQHGFFQDHEANRRQARRALGEFGLTETTGKQRDRAFANASYLEKLRFGTEVDLT